MRKPELLLPAGSMEMFFAAMEGGADAVYAGVKNFNARSRAKNFSFADIYNICQEAHRRNKKVYVTLNTIIKNSELPEILNTINLLNKSGVDAIIFQDLAVLNFVKKLYRNIEAHASTQFGIHNSIGVEYLRKHGVKRSILSREVNFPELEMISRKKKAPSEIEIFVHGALCYSFSGQCLFSSYLGGFSANRGMCAQVCRREFKTENNAGNVFSLKDLELIDYIPKLSEIGISSLKIEGRMKSADYAYVTAKAYRMAIDNHEKIKEAKELLRFDFAREKTSWFVGKKLDNAITENQGAGIFVGRIYELDENGFKVKSEVEIKEYHRLRCRNAKDTEANFVNIDKISHSGSDYFINCDIKGLNIDDEVYIVGTKQFKYKIDLPRKAFITTNLNFKQSQKIVSTFKLKNKNSSKEKYYLRTSDVNGLLIPANQFECIILKSDLRSLKELIKAGIDSKLKSKLIIELPKYISELNLNEYRSVIADLNAKGLKQFSLSHVSQKELLPNGAEFITNESVYALNDIAINFIQSEGAKEYIYPYENEYPNLLKGRDRNGIIPIFFYPELFYSRMPVKSGDILRDNTGKKYHKVVKSGFTVIYPDQPVSLTHNISKLKSKGFNKFLIDISYEKNPNRIGDIMKSLKNSSKIQGTSDFNMKKGLR